MLQFVGGELGGANKLIKYVSGTFYLCLWLLYIVLMSVQVYKPDALPW